MDASKKAAVSAGLYVVAFLGLLFFEIFRGQSIAIYAAAACLIFFLYSFLVFQKFLALCGKVFLGRPEVHSKEASQLAAQARSFRDYSEGFEDKLASISSVLSITVALAAVVANPWWLSVACIFAGLTVVHRAKTCFPGAVLVLGPSNDATRRLVMLIQKTLRGLNVTSFINFVSANEAADHLEKISGHRITNPVVSWLAAVETHAALAKVLVLNTSHVTEQVNDEFELLGEKGFFYKTIIIVGEGLTSEMSETALANGALLVESNAECEAVVQSVFPLSQLKSWGGGDPFQFPSPEAPISTFGAS